MAEGKQPAGLADRIKADLGGMEIFGPARAVFQRVLQAVSGRQDLSTISLGLDRSLKFGAVLLDATRAPFRVGGRKWSLAYDLAAGGAGNFGFVYLRSEIDRQPKDGLALITIEEVRYQGPSTLGIAAAFRTGAPVSAAVGRARDLELPIQSSRSAASTFTGKSVVPYIASVGTNAGGAPTIECQTFLGNVAAGNTPDVWKPDGLVLWPGEELNLLQQTANVVMTVTVSGKVWLFNPADIGA